MAIGDREQTPSTSVNVESSDTEETFDISPMFLNPVSILEQAGEDAKLHNYAANQYKKKILSGKRIQLLKMFLHGLNLLLLINDLRTKFNLGAPEVAPQNDSRVIEYEEQLNITTTEFSRELFGIVGRWNKQDPQIRRAVLEAKKILIKATTDAAIIRRKANDCRDIQIAVMNILSIAFLALLCYLVLFFLVFPNLFSL